MDEALGGTGDLLALASDGEEPAVFCGPAKFFRGATKRARELRVSRCSTAAPTPLTLFTGPHNSGA